MQARIVYNPTKRDSLFTLSLIADSGKALGYVHGVTTDHASDSDGRNIVTVNLVAVDMALSESAGI